MTARTTGTTFTSKHRHVATLAFEELGDYPIDALVDAARLYRKQHAPGMTQRTIAALGEEFMRSQHSAGTSEAGLRDYKFKVGKFCSRFGDRLAHEISTVEIEEWMDSHEWAGKSRKQYRGTVRTLFRFAKKRGYIQADPTEGLLTVKVKQRLPSILTPKQTQDLLNAARAYGGGLMLPYFAIGAFAGLRPEEIRRLSWDKIDFDAGEIYVAHEDSKTAQDRFVAMSECLIAWLSEIPAKARSGRLNWSRRAFDDVRRNAGVLDHWDNSVLRHGAASHLYAKTGGNAALVTAQMGHGLDVFLRHYKRAVTKSQAQKYFEITPSSRPGAVIALRISS
jgi:integrase